MRSFLLVALVAALGAASAAPAAAQEDVPADTTAPADTTDAEPPPSDTRLTWLGDTLPGEPPVPKFAKLPEIFPDSLVDPYTPERAGARPAWVLTGEQLVGRGSFSLLDVLESEVLVAPVDLGGTGAPVYMMPAHGTPTNLQVFIDGVPAGTPFAAAWDLRQLPVEGIARIAYYPGPQSAAWGAGATGGVLSITTRRALAETARSSLSFILGSFDADGFSGNFGRHVTSRGEVFLAANFDTSDGFVRAGDFTRNQTVFRAGWRFGERHRIEFSHVADGLSGRANRRNLADEEDQDRSLSHVFYHGRVGPVAVRAHYWSEALELLANQTLDGRIGLTGASDETGAKANASVEVGPLRVWGEVVWEESETMSDHVAFDASGGGGLLDPPDEEDPDARRLVDPRSRTEWAGGVGWSGLADRVSASAAVRRLDWGESADAGTAWRVDARAHPAEAWTVSASAGHAVRAADLVGQATLLALAPGEIRPGREADPEALEAWDEIRADVTWERPGWRARIGAWRATGDGAFLWLPPSAWNRFDRGTTDVRLGTTGLNTFDVVDLETTGVEFEAVVPLPYAIKGVFRWRSVDAAETITGEDLPYLPARQALGQLRWARRLFPSRDLLVEARLTGRFSGERTTLEGETLPSYLLADALVQATVINFTVYLSFKNLMNQAYRIEDAFFLPQREGYFGVVWRFRE